MPTRPPRSVGRPSPERRPLTPPPTTPTAGRRCCAVLASALVSTVIMATLVVGPFYLSRAQRPHGSVPPLLISPRSGEHARNHAGRLADARLARPPPEPFPIHAPSNGRELFAINL